MQVNLSPGETYTLTATATNSVGTASATINLSAPGTGSSTSTSSAPPVNHPPDVADINIPGGTLYTDTIYVVSAASSDSDGDSLTYLWTATGGTFTNPAFGGMWVGVVDWGAEALVLADFGLPQVGIQLFDMAGGGNITCDTATLKTQLQSAINAGKSRFQIRISHPGIVSNLNNTWDGWSYLQAGVNLNINYH
ncbi:MAG: hypothetical protein ACYDIA_14065 [Candidatus Humimicrobiaceae bacterium]